MFTIQQFTTESHSALALEIGTPYEDDGERCNILRVGIWKFCWYITIPQIIKPKEQWVDLSHADWATERNGKKGYMDIIRRSYGFAFNEDAVHIHYGIQPGSWSRDDPANSDHVVLLNYPWNYEHIRHHAYYIDGTYASDGEYFHEWERTINNLPYNKDSRIADFQTVKWFTLPKVDRPFHRGENRSLNFSDVCTSNPVYKFFEYTDQYDGEVTVARVNIEEREWIRGRWGWLRSVLKHIPGCRIVRRDMCIDFRNEVGNRKGTWKGGTLGMGFAMLPNETIDECWHRFVDSNSRP